MDNIGIGFKFRTNFGNYYISDIHRKKLLSITSPLLVTINDSSGNKVVTYEYKLALNELNKERWIPL